MSEYINQQFKAFGVAQVIAVLESPAVIPPATAAVGGQTGEAAAASSASLAAAQPAGAMPPPPPAVAPALAGLEQHFEHSEYSQRTALASAGLHSAVSLSASGAGAAAAAERPAHRPATPSAVRYFPNLGVMFGTVTPLGLASLRADDRVRSVTGAPQIGLIQPNRTAPARLDSTVTWGVEFLKAPRLWREGLTGEGVVVAHLDTGADGRHPALRRSFASFAEFDMIGELVDGSDTPFDTADHGTHTAATIAGRETQGRSVGVAPGAELASAIVIEGGEVVARVLAGMDWALSQRVRVISMSLGFRGWWEDFIPVTQILRAQNVLPVIAVGNEGPGTSRSPGNYSEALSVGAIDRARGVAPFSSSQRFQRSSDPVVPDLVAPGVDIISAKPGGGFQAMDGTSMATPHIAGLAALLFEAKPEASVSEVETAIYNSCKLEPMMNADRANRGYPNAVEALFMLTGTRLSSGKTPAKKGAPAQKAVKVAAKKGVAKGASGKKGVVKASGAGKEASKKGAAKKASSKKGFGGGRR